MKSGSAPESPNPQVTIPLQGRENRRTFDYTLAGSRVNQQGPMGSSTWNRTPQFDNEGYQRAIAGFLSGGGQAPAGGWYTPPGSGDGRSSIPELPPIPREQTAALPPPNRGQVPSDRSYRLSSDPAGGDAAFGGDTTGGNDPGPGIGGGDVGSDGNGPSGPSGGDGGPSDDPRFGGGTGSGGDSSSASGIPGLPNSEDFFTNQWTQTTRLSPEQQALYESSVGNQQGAQQRIAALMARPDLDMGRFDERFNALDPRAFGTEAADAMYRQSSRYMDPESDTARRTLEGRLADQGFVPGTPAYEREMDLFRQTQERGRADARDRALTLGATVGSQQFGNSLQALQAQLAQTLAGRSAPINELNALRTGDQFQMPNLSGGGSAPTPGMSPVDALGQFNQQYQGQLAGYNADVSQGNTNMAAIASLLAAFMSDKRLKENIIQIGETRDGIPLMMFNYLGDSATQVGVLAQDVQKVRPEAVVETASGFLAVRYGLLGVKHG